MLTLLNGGLCPRGRILCTGALEPAKIGRRWGLFLLPSHAASSLPPVPPTPPDVGPSHLSPRARIQSCCFLCPAALTGSLGELFSYKDFEDAYASCQGPDWYCQEHWGDSWERKTNQEPKPNETIQLQMNRRNANEMIAYQISKHKKKENNTSCWPRFETDTVLLVKIKII